MRPLWFVEFLKRNFKRRFLIGRLTKLPIIGKILLYITFEGDSLTVLPKEQVVIEINKSLEKEKQFMLPSKVIEHFINKASKHWIMNFCICREGNDCKNYPKDLGCLFLGEGVVDINPHIGRLVSKEEALEHAQKCRDAGLVHVIGKNKLDAGWLGVKDDEKLLTICNCCECCCLAGTLRVSSPKVSEVYQRMPGVHLEVQENCVGCKKAPFSILG